MRSIGADHVIDYTKEDFTINGQHYDLILDNVATRSIFDIKRSLSPKGDYAVIGGTSILQFVFLGPLISMTGKKMGLIIHKTNMDLDYIVKLVEEGKIKPVIDKQYPLRKVAEALRYFEEGHAKGKVVITCEG